MKLNKKISHAVGKAIHDYSMVSPNERILLGISGGRDSLTLLALLSALKKKAPVDFDILPVYVDPGFEISFAKELEAYVKSEFGGVVIEYSDCGVYAHTDANRENPCFLCARLRRKRLFEIAEKENCKKIALGHHKDDIIETLFINILYSGRIGTMHPAQQFFNGKFKIIRPLCYVDKETINKFFTSSDLPWFENQCPSAGKSKRARVRNMLEDLYAENRHVKGNIFKAMSNISSDYLLGHYHD